MTSQLLHNILVLAAVCLYIATCESDSSAADQTSCSSLTSCGDCIGKEGCVYFTCNLPDNAEKKCNQNLTVSELCNNASAPIEYIEKCTGNTTETGDGKDKDNPVEELDGGDQKSGDQTQVHKYHATQHFDLASFVGGIALSVCLAGIAFIIYKLWQSKQQHLNYSSVDGKSQY